MAAFWDFCPKIIGVKPQYEIRRNTQAAMLYVITFEIDCITSDKKKILGGKDK